ncbi:hypothetical protein EPK99_10385 [Neorhizobium lilium]|uniref:Uncharacterized protein n=1 Tax=Neorhizobium lilium TaxID=2503024 RepID=A0A444LIW9_9HYPH|nr:hypothetical protein [Neorhizobium lilium]RWX78973.1 hypothetical protein EPK99_10385 [Neorhizobium lilium]
MNIDQYIEIYHRTDVDGLNDAVGTLEGEHHTEVLKSLEARGFDIMWRSEGGKGTAGVVVRGPDEKLGFSH